MAYMHKENKNFESSNTYLKHAIEAEERGAVMQAVASYKQVLALDPSHKQAQKRLKKLADSMNRMNPLYQKGITYFHSGQWQQATECFQKAKAILPQVPEVLTNLALSLQQIGQYDEAYFHIQNALHHRPDYAEALNILGNLEQHRGTGQAALTAYKAAVAAKPDYLTALNNLAKMQQKLKLDAQAIESYKASLAVNSQQGEILAELHYQLLSLHRWSEAQKIARQLQNILKEPNQTAGPFSLLLFDNPALQLQNATVRSLQRWPHVTQQTAISEKKGKWRIGYLSSDFHEHATAYLIAELFERHDTQRFDVFAYSAGPNRESAERQRIRQHSSFRDIANLVTLDAAKQISHDKIDILVDLKGHTSGNRLDILALRPAPIQLHYLGYPGTTGFTAVNYLIADNVTIPPGNEKYFSEKIIRMPDCYQINDRKRPLPEQLPRKNCGLPEAGLVFCNFNQSYKITYDIFTVWMRLLKAIPDSVLWLLEHNADATRNIKTEAGKQGIDPARLLMASHAPLAHHLNRYQHVDLVLDSFPVTSHTTASDALWCGVPVLTLVGNSFASRVAASLLHAVRLEELVTENIMDYEKLALSLAQNPEKLQKMKKHLHDGRMQFPLFDSETTTRALEKAYMDILESGCLA